MLNGSKRFRHENSLSLRVIENASQIALRGNVGSCPGHDPEVPSGAARPWGLDDVPERQSLTILSSPRELYSQAPCRAKKATGFEVAGHKVARFPSVQS